MSNKRTLQLKVDEAVTDGRYANLCAVHIGDNEFVMDFAFVQPGTGQGRIHSRVILSPQQAKQLRDVLATRVALFEERRGEIELPSLPPVTKH